MKIFLLVHQNSINPKFGLLEALLKVGAWSEAESLISRLPTYYAVSQPLIARALMTLIHTTMDPIHRECSSGSTLPRTTTYPALDNKSAPKPAQSFEEFQERVVPMLLALGPYAYTDPILLYKILRIMKSALGIVSTGSRQNSGLPKSRPPSVCPENLERYFGGKSREKTHRNVNPDLTNPAC